MKKEYVQPDAEWIRYSSVSVITESGDDEEFGPGYGPDQPDYPKSQWY